MHHEIEVKIHAIRTTTCCTTFQNGNVLKVKKLDVLNETFAFNLYDLIQSEE